MVVEDYPAGDVSVDRIEANDHFFAIFGKLRPVQGNLAELLAAARSLAARSDVIYLETATAYVPDPDARTDLGGSIRWNDDLGELRRTVRADPRFADIRERRPSRRSPVSSSRRIGSSGAGAKTPMGDAVCSCVSSRRQSAPSIRLSCSRASCSHTR